MSETSSHRVTMIAKDSSKREVDGKVSALASTPVGKQAKHLAEEVCVAALIKALPLTAHKRQTILPGSGASLLDKFQLLEHLRPDERLAFFEGVLARALNGSRDVEFLCAVLVRAGYALKRNERQQLLGQLTGQKPQGASARCWVALARSAGSLTEAQQLVQGCGRERLIAHRNRELREFVVTVELLSSLRAVERPQPLSIHTLNRVALQRADEELRATYRSAQQRLLEHESWAGSSKKLTALTAMLKLSAKTFTRHMSLATAASEKNEVLRTTYARLAVELRYGKPFTELSPKNSAAPTARWSIDEMHTVVKAIKLIGDFHLATADRISEFRRVRDLGDDSVADYEDPSGIISLTDSAFNISHKRWRHERSGRTPLETVVHEIGHGLSLASIHKLKNEVENGASIMLGDFLRADHFPEIFLRLGRWYSASSGYRVDTATGIAFLRNDAGKEQAITLDQPVYIETEKDARRDVRVYSHLPDYRLLIWHEPRKAEFTERAYGRQDPTEMLAELYGAYFGERKTVFRLIQNAPNLFWYMESLYHRFSEDKAVQSTFRARLSKKQDSSGIARALERESSEQSVFRMLTDEEQTEVVTQLLSTSDLSTDLATSRAARGRVFTSFAKRASIAEGLQEILHPVLSRYNPGILLARTILGGGGDLAIASIRGTTENDLNSQQPMYDLLHKAIGARLDEARVFFLDDFHRSKRLGNGPFAEKFRTVIAEHLDGVSTPAPGHIKSLPKMYEKVIVYTGIPAVAEYLRAYAHEKGLKKSLRVIEVNAIASKDIAKRLLRKSQEDPGNTLHFFTLEETLIDLREDFRVVNKESGTILDTIPIKKFLKKINPQAWLDEISEKTGIKKQLLAIDTSDVTSRVALRVQIDEGLSHNKALKSFATDGRLKTRRNAEI